MGPGRVKGKLEARRTIDVGTLEQWLWDVACELRGPLDAPKFKDYILPLVFLKRLSDVFDDDIARMAAESRRAVAVPQLAGTLSQQSQIPDRVRLKHPVV